MQDELASLIARVEAGTAEQQRELLLSVYDVLLPAIEAGTKGMPHYHAFSRKINANAFVDAALMMVPEPKSWAVGQHGEGVAGASVFLLGGAMFKAEASTPALALTAAILRARMADDAR